MKIYQVTKHGKNNNKTVRFFVNKNLATKELEKAINTPGTTSGMIYFNTNKQKALELLKIGRTEKAAKQILKNNESLSAKEIIKNIKESGNLDLNYIEYAAYQDGVSKFNYLVDYVKNNYDCHKNTARAVAKYFLY